MTATSPGRLVVRLHRPPVSGVVRLRAAAVALALGLGGTAGFAVSLAVGDFPVPLAEVVRTLSGGGAAETAFVVTELRLPRALTGMLVGAAFGLSGAILQSVARNPLASPDILGITAGAAAAAVAVIVLGGGPSALGVPVAALGGGLLTALAVYVLAWRRGVTGYRLVLVGIGVGAALTSVTQFLLVRAELTDAARATVWLTGSLNGRGWDHVVPVGLAVALLLPVTLALSRRLALLQYGDDTASGLGVAVERSRVALVLAAVGLAAVATASAGPVGFVALVSPQIARRLTRTPGIPPVCSALTGAALVLASDLLARRLLAPTELPVGIVTAGVGAPYLLWLLARTNRVGRGG